MSALVVILAGSGVVVSVRETLRDLSAVGLIDPFVWLPADQVTAGTMHALTVEHGRASGTSIQAIAQGTRFEQVRLVSLVPVLHGETIVDSPIEQQVAQLLENSTGGAAVTRIRAIVTRVGDPQVSDAIARIGWHNVLLAPEESVGPGLGHALLQATDDVDEIGRHAATALAGVAGLWSGVTGSPFDGLTPDPGESARVARSYYRRLQSDALEAELRTRVTATSDSLPLPVEGAASAVYVEDVALATTTMSKGLWARHQDVLKGPRDRRKASSAEAIGALKAIKMFFGFLWAAIKNAPQQWVRSIIVSASSRVAGAVHGAVFGSSPSAYAVVVNGVTPSGLPASWLDLASAADAIEDVIEDTGEVREHHALSDHSELWKEYAAGALTLADAGDRVQGMAPVQIGSQRGVLRSVELCVPPPSSRFTEIPGHIAAQIEIDSVDAFDVLAVNNLHARLTHLQREAAIGLEVGGTLQALQAWNSLHKGSYAARVGSVLGEAVVSTAAEIRALLDGLKKAAASEDLPAAIAARQKKLGRALQIISLLFAIAGIAVGVVFGFGLISATVALIAAAGVLVGWLGVAIITFLRGQRELFSLINARQELIANAELMKRNLRQAVRDLRRQTDAYAQFLAWSRLLGAVLAAPLGTPASAQEDGGRLSAGLPLPVKLGSASVDADKLANAVVTLRREIFRTGWLTEPWDALIAAAPSTIGPEAYELRDNPAAIFRQPGSGDTSLLLRWVDIVQERGIDSAVADRLWGAVQEQLDGDKKQVAESLLSSIVELGPQDARPMPHDVFMAGVDSPDLASGRFDPIVFAPESRASANSAVDRSWGLQSRRGLSRSAVLVQISAGAPAYSFASYASGPGGPIPPLPDPGLVF